MIWSLNKKDKQGIAQVRIKEAVAGKVDVFEHTSAVINIQKNVACSCVIS